MTTTKPILNFSIDPALLKRVDEFWHANRFPNRATAVKWLLDWALKEKPKPGPSVMETYAALGAASKESSHIEAFKAMGKAGKQKGR